MGLRTPDETGRTRRRNRLFRTLSNARRRTVLRRLGECEKLDVSELAEQIRHGNSETEGREAVNDLAIDLYHAQLPCLADADLVRFDPDENTVALTERGAAVRSSLGDLDRLVR